MRSRRSIVACVFVVGCSSGGGEGAVDASIDSSTLDDVPVDEGAHDSTAHDASSDVATEASTDAHVDAAPCTTRVTYGDAWIHPGGHPDAFDDAPGDVTWDGTCTDDGGNSFALLSNGWKPYFSGNGACVLAFDHHGACSGVASTCTTRVSYGAAWKAPAGHGASFDDITDRVFSDDVCHDDASGSWAWLSNGWQPHFTGSGACRLSFRYDECGGLYDNPVISGDCPDPGVLVDGSSYVLTCTSGNAADAYLIYTSPDLVHWSAKAHIFPSASKPSWAKSDFWAPEIHKVGTHYVAYFSARGSDGMLAIGAASASSALGPFTALDHPLVHDASVGLIDASEITAADGTPYVLWKEDGNAIGHPTPIHAQKLAADGLSLVGSPATLITNDQSWEGNLVEGPFMIAHAGEYFLFYSANAYYDGRYAVGVARGSSPMGPFTKKGPPILVSDAAWVGPGHCSVVDTPGGDTYMVYHSWKAGCVNAPGCGREDLADMIVWGSDGWPTVPLAPSSNSRPMP